MKTFLKDHSYDMVKMFLDQFATSIFGFVMALVSSKLGNPLLRTVLSAFSVLFYLFLLYTMTWEIGFADRAKVRNGKKENLFLGTLISLGANLINYVIAIVILLGNLIASDAFSHISVVAVNLTFWLEGMYSGILSNRLFGNPLNSYWISYFLIPLPAILTSTVAYLLGYRDKKCTSLFDPVIPLSDREDKKHWWKK